MHSHLNYEIARARQREIAARMLLAEHAGELRLITGPRRTHRQRISQALAACLAVASPRRSPARIETPAP